MPCSPFVCTESILHEVLLHGVCISDHGVHEAQN